MSQGCLQLFVVCCCLVLCAHRAQLCSMLSIRLMPKYTSGLDHVQALDRLYAVSLSANPADEGSNSIQHVCSGPGVQEDRQEEAP